MGIGMNISNVNIKLTGRDILSIFNDFVSIDEITIEDIKIKEQITVVGSFKKKNNIDFEVVLKLVSIEGEVIEVEVVAFKVLSIGIISIFRKLALKYALKALADKGIIYKKGKVHIYYKYLLKDIPYVDFSLVSLLCYGGIINAEIKDLQISLGGELKKEVSLFEEKETEKDEVIGEVVKLKDSYTLGRSKVMEKVPKKIKKYSEYIFILPDIAALIYRLLKDQRVELRTKLIISASVAYIVFPTDVIPDKIPFIGKIDEVAVAFFALNKIVTEVPLNVILENWEGKNDIILVIKSLIEYTINFTKATNVDKLYSIIDEIASL